MSARYWSDGAAGPVLATEGRRARAWRDLVACGPDTADLFFGPLGERPFAFEKRVTQAKLVCAGCTARAECLASAMQAEEGQGAGTRDGVFGGLTAHERAGLERRGALPAVPRHRSRPAIRPPAVRPQPSRAAPPPRPGKPVPDYTPEEIASFWDRTRKGGCGTEWALSVSKDGFGLFRIGSRTAARIAAHRLAYKLLTGHDPGDDPVVQQCGNRRCLTRECLAAVPRLTTDSPSARAA